MKLRHYENGHYHYSSQPKSDWLEFVLWVLSATAFLILLFW